MNTILFLFRAKQIYTKSATDACIHKHFFVNLFGGYATPRKHIVFSRLALNSNDYFLSLYRRQEIRKTSIFNLIGSNTGVIVTFKSIGLCTAICFLKHPRCNRKHSLISGIDYVITRVCHLESRKWSLYGSIFVVDMGFFQCS